MMTRISHELSNDCDPVASPVTAPQFEGPGSRPVRRHRRYVLVTETLHEYRAHFYALLRARLGHELAFFAATRNLDANGTPSFYPPDLDGLFDCWILPRPGVIWHRGAVRQALRADVAMVHINPRILSNWAILLLRKVGGRPTILWGHAWPRRGKSSPTDRLRHAMRSLAEVLVTFTETDAAELRLVHPRIPVIAAPNSLYPKAEIAPAVVRDGHVPRDVVYVGRLIASKKPLLLLEGFARATDELGSDTRLIIVGEGPLATKLRLRAGELGIDERVEFHGHQADREYLRALYARSLVAVSPGYVGLSVTQALSFGVPMLIADCEPHAPEIEAARKGWNAEFFRSDSPASLARALVAFNLNADAWLRRRPAIASDCADRYSVDVMVERIIAAFVLAERRRQLAR